jgi:quinohemoprotein ethanol dehydrogenase
MKRLAITASTAVLVAAVVVLSAGCGGGGGKSSSSGTSPAFSPDELAAQPTTNWITNGGSISNQRYSPLKEIDTGNVSRLKGLWHVHLRSGTAGKYSGEAQPIVYKNVIYIVTGADDVFAIDAKSGATKWSYRANLNQKISTICCGWTNRGVALGDGRVYLGQLDGKFVALDQNTGRVAWSTQVGNYRQGTTITGAPLYYDGRVYTGLSGGEYGIRGRLTALDAKTGKELWRFYTIPGPGQVGHDSWPATGDGWKHGGAPVWQTPAVDPKLGLLYFSTGNASPDFNAAARPGDNLFASSILAIDAKTGQYRWHFQEVHHDIWDYDATSPVVLFTA